jgi:poly(3-hydroxybutyrate) depolymerase
MLFITYGARAQETIEKVTVDDVNRTYLVRLPQGYDQKKKYPVVILLHGLSQSTDDMEQLTRFDELADKYGIIAVYPRTLHGHWNVGVRPPSQQPMTRPPGSGDRHGGGGYTGGGGGYPGGGQSGGQR